MSYLDSNIKKECYGCEACIQVCSKNAITMKSDEEGFRYPKIDKEKCINCNLCRKICPYQNIEKYQYEHKAFGGYIKDESIRNESTSGGAFSAICQAFCDENYIVFGAVAKGLKVYHTFVDSINRIDIFRKSKYSQSNIGNCYLDVKNFLLEGKKVLFSGTPCQNAGLKKYLQNVNQDNLLMVEVVCEGVPSPIYVNKLEKYLIKKYNSNIKNLDYRNKDIHNGKIFKYGKWDFEVMKADLQNNKVIKKDRWFNPFWNIWLNHLMSRPSCYECGFATNDRVADITLGDLWGVHIYCPELYGNNKGASLVISNSPKGEKYLKMAKDKMFGHDLEYEVALKYQSPLRKHISNNPKREEFMKDLKDPKIDYKRICRKWYQKPSIKLLLSKYIWGNRQKVFIWNLKNRKRKEELKND